MQGSTKPLKSESNNIRDELAVVLGSEAFSKSKRNRELLNYLVEESLAGHADRLKGYRVAIDVFNKSADFDAQNNPLVRNQMVRLRRVLDYYYLTEGIDAPIRIQFIKGKYAPRIEYVSETSTSTGESTAKDVRPTLLITPFLCHGENREQLHFTAGLTQELMAALSRFGYLQIIATESSTVVQFSGDNCYILRGICRQYAKRIRVNFELTEQQTGHCLWAEQFECNLDVEDIFDLQDRITREVASKVADHYGEISHRMTLDLKAQSPDSMSAYEAVLVFYYYELDLKQSLLPQVIDNLRLATYEEPDNDLAWAALAEATADSFVHGYCADLPLLDQSKQYGDRAVSLDPRCQHAYWSRVLGYHLSSRPGDEAVVESALETLVEINPNSVGFVCGAGLVYCLRGRWQYGLSLIRQFNDHQTRAPRWINLAEQLFEYLEGNFQHSLNLNKQMKTEMVPWDCLLPLLCLWNLNHLEEAVEAYRRMLDEHFALAGDGGLTNYIKSFVKDSDARATILSSLEAVSTV